MSSRHSHRFVEEYDGLVAFGMSRDVDEKSIKYYLQKFSDDAFLEVLVPRLKDDEIVQIFDMLTHIMKKHLSEDEYHEVFLKDR